MLEILIYATAFFCTLSGVRLFVGWSRRRNLLDIPNERSSHTKPTPRGGGLIFVFIGLSFYLFYTVLVTGDFCWQYFVGAVLIAAISWLDDLYSISFVWRIIVHALAALLIVQSLGQVPAVYPFTNEFDFVNVAGYAAAFLWIVWLTNAYNFMDGIDGIASAQAVCAGVGWLLVGKLMHLDTVGVFGGVLAFSSLGFLVFNWHPAKVFMGDVGSTFLGFSFAALPFLAARENAGGFRNWFLIGVWLVWLFCFDTIVTLLRRLWRREHFWRAHRSHIFQQLTASGFSHSPIAALYAFLGAFNAALALAALLENKLIFVLLCSALIESLGLVQFLRWAKKRVDSSLAA